MIRVWGLENRVVDQDFDLAGGGGGTHLLHASSEHLHAVAVGLVLGRTLVPHPAHVVHSRKKLRSLRPLRVSRVRHLPTVGRRAPGGSYDF